MSISPLPQSGAKGLERLTWLKYYIILKQQITFNLGLNTAKNMHYIKKSFKYKLSRIKFRTKFNPTQLLFGIFFGVIHIFCSIQPWSVSTFPFQYIMITSVITPTFCYHWNDTRVPLVFRFPMKDRTRRKWSVVAGSDLGPRWSSCLVIISISASFQSNGMWLPVPKPSIVTSHKCKFGDCIRVVQPNCRSIVYRFSRLAL